MKDWKAEYDKLRGQMAQLEKDLQWFRNQYEQRLDRDTETRDKFKELLLDVLGR